MWPSLMLSCQSTCLTSPGLQGPSKEQTAQQHVATSSTYSFQAVLPTEKCRWVSCSPQQLSRVTLQQTCVPVPKGCTAARIACAVSCMHPRAFHLQYRQFILCVLYHHSQYGSAGAELCGNPLHPALLLCHLANHRPLSALAQAPRFSAASL